MADDWYRVQIAGSGFIVTCEASPDEGEKHLSPAHFASRAMYGAVAMASYNLPCVMQVLANVVSHVHPWEAGHVEALRAAEDAFHDAARDLIMAWRKFDKDREEDTPGDSASVSAASH